MKPFIDRSIGLIERSIDPITTSPSNLTINFDQYRQGVEVTLTRHYLRSTTPYVSSKGIISNDSEVVNHELDYTSLGQGIGIEDLTPFNDQLIPNTAAGVLQSNLIQSDTDPFFGRAAQDGQIDVFSDTGKRSLLPNFMPFNARGIRALSTTIGWIYNFNDTLDSAFLDATDVFLNLAAEGYGGPNESYKPFNDIVIVNKFSTKIDYTYIGPDEKSPSAGYDYYGSIYTTDSIAYGGFLR